MSKRQSIIETVKALDCDRTFILFGKCNSGKSALGNLLLGPGATTQFSTHPRPEPSGHTKKILSGESELEASSVYGEGYTGNNRVKIQVIDQPGCNDTEHFMFSNQCIEMSKSETNATFLIVINLNCRYFSQEEFESIMKIAETLSKSKYCLFTNAIIVFTHAEMLDKNLKRENMEEIVHQKIRKQNYGYIHYLLDLVEQRYIFVNAVNNGGINRNNTLGRLLQLTRPRLNVKINGNNSFKGSKLKQLLGEDIDANTIIEHDPTYKCDIEYSFNPECNLTGRYDVTSLKEGMINTLNKLNGISRGVSAFVVLLNLQEVFTEEICSYVTNTLPFTYNFGDKINHGFWDYVGIVFKVRMDSKDFVRRQIDANPKLKQLDRMVHSRYCWVTDRSSPEECYERIGNLAKEVASSNKWGNYTDTALVGEMRDQIQENFAYKYFHTKVIPPKLEDGAEGEMLCEPLTDRDDLLSINHRFWGTKFTGISTKIGYFILNKINVDLAKQFKKKYSEDRIATETFVDFCLEWLKI